MPTLVSAGDMTVKNKHKSLSSWGSHSSWGKHRNTTHESQIYNTFDGSGYYRDTEAGKERRGGDAIFLKGDI